MKSIIETINESAKSVIIAFSYHDPETAYIFTNVDEKNKK